VPESWELHPEFCSYRGTGVYRKHINNKNTCALRLVFKGVSHTADVYLDGKHIGQHYNAYTPFSMVVPEVEAGWHEIKVVVDNTFSENSALHKPNDYYTYGGITRPVVVEQLNNAFIERVEFNPFMQENTWKANIRAYIKNICHKPAKIKVKGELGDNNLEFGLVKIGGNKSTTVEKTFSFNNIKAWLHEKPNLYLLNTRLYTEKYEAVDDLIERVGFRTVSTKGQKFLVNGEEIKIKGFNRHEDHPMAGASIPFQLMVKDMELMRDMGANAVRTCHYPNDELFLDLCDEYGIFVWEENHARGLSLEDMQNKNFEKQCEDCNREMVQNHYNHPSIIIWGILNECASYTKEGRELYKKQLEQIRSMDKERLLTFATCHLFKDICLDMADVVSFNIYTGWYIDSDTKEHFDKVKKWAEENGGENKPIIISEFGAGAIYGYRNPTRVKWTEERQADVLDETLKVYLNRDEICGTFIWQFSDCRITEEGGWFAKRPGTKNNKGVVDEYRRPKLAYGTVKKYYGNQG